MSMKSDDSGKGTAYFSDGHTEGIIDFEISKDGRDIWFTVESGKWFVYKEELVCCDTESKRYYPECKFYTVLINRNRDAFGATCDVQYLVTDDIERIVLHMRD